MPETQETKIDDSVGATSSSKEGNYNLIVDIYQAKVFFIVCCYYWKPCLIVLFYKQTKKWISSCISCMNRNSCNFHYSIHRWICTARPWPCTPWVECPCTPQTFVHESSTPITVVVKRKKPWPPHRTYDRSPSWDPPMHAPAFGWGLTSCRAQISLSSNHCESHDFLLASKISLSCSCPTVVVVSLSLVRVVPLCEASGPYAEHFKPTSVEPELGQGL